MRNVADTGVERRGAGRGARGLDDLGLPDHASARGTRIVLPAGSVQVEPRQLRLERRDFRVLPQFTVREQSRKQRASDDFWMRAALEKLAPGRSPELGLPNYVASGEGKAQPSSVFTRLAGEYGCGTHFAALLGGRDGGVEILERKLLQVVFAQNADAVDEALEHVLERPALAADLHEHLKAVERAFALSDQFEVVCRFLEQSHARDHRVVRLGCVVATPSAASEIEAGQRTHVGVPSLTALGKA